MPVLVELDYHKDANEVHVGGVELEVDVGGADVVAGRHDPLHQQGPAYPIEQTEVRGSSKLFSIKIVKFLDCLVILPFL